MVAKKITSPLEVVLWCALGGGYQSSLTINLYRTTQQYYPPTHRPSPWQFIMPTLLLGSTKCLTLCILDMWLPKKGSQFCMHDISRYLPMVKKSVVTCGTSCTKQEEELLPREAGKKQVYIFWRSIYRVLTSRPFIRSPRPPIPC